MATIPVYQQRNAIGGVQSAPRASSVVSGSSPVAAGLGALSSGLGRAADVIQQKIEDQSAQDVANVLSQGRVYWQQQVNEKQQAWNPGDPDLRDVIGQDFDAWKEQNVSKLKTDKSKSYFEQQAIQMRTSMLMGAYDYTQKKTTDKLNADSMLGMEADEQAVFADPKSMQQVLASRAEAVMARRDISEEDKARLLIPFKQKLALAAEMGEQERSPEAWYAARFGGMPESVGGTVKPGVPAGSGSYMAVANAIYGQESSFGKADTSRVNSQNVTGPMQMQEGTFNQAKKMGLVPSNYDWKNPAHNKEAGFAWVQYLDKKYEGDPAKVAAAYYGGEGAVSADGTIKRHWKNKQRPQDPTVGEYVDQVLGRMQKNGEVVASGEQQPTPRGTFGALPWEQQMRLKNAAEQRIKQDRDKLFASLSIESAATAVQAQEIGVSGQVDDALALSQAVAEVEARTGQAPDAQQLQMIEAQISRAARLREQQRKTEQDNTKATLLDLLDQNGGDYQALIATNAADLDRLPRADLDSLQKYAGEVATGGTRVTDWQAYAQLVDNPDMLASVNLAALKDKFSRDEYAQLVRLQAQSRKDKEEGRPQTILTDMQVVKDLLDEKGVSKNSDREKKFFSLLQQQMYAKMAAEGKSKLNQEEVKNLAADLLVKEVIKKRSFWFDETDLAFEIEVPATEEAKIRAALQAAGMPVNPSTILRVYRNKLQKAQQPKQAASSNQPQGSW